MAFELIKLQWYALEIISDYFADLHWEIRHRAPIQILSTDVTPVEPKGEFQLGFLEMFYPAGVRKKRYPLRVIEWGDAFLLAERTDEHPRRIVLIMPLTREWLIRRWEAEMRDGQTPEEWLDAVLHDPGF